MLELLAPIPLREAVAKTLPTRQAAPAPQGGLSRVIGVTLLLAAAVAALGLPHLTAHPLGPDGAASLRYATTPGVAGISENGGDMALYYLCLKVLAEIFGVSGLTLRLPSVVFGAATLPIVEELGRRIWNRRVGVVSALLFGVSLPLVTWEGAARGYTLGTFLVSAAVLAWITFARRPGVTRAAVFVGLSTLATYTLLLNWWVLAGQFVVWVSCCVIRRHHAGDYPARAARWWLAGALALVGIWTAQLAVIALDSGMSRFVVSRNAVTPARLARTLTVLASAYSGGSDSPWELAAAALTLATVVLWVAGARRSSPAHSGPADRSMGGFAVATVVLWLVAPMIGQVGVSLFAHPIYQYRYFVMCLPAAALLTAAGLERLGPTRAFPYALTLGLVAGAHMVFLSTTL
jgi:mannosyltransferase